jgi:hypothetical protein
MGYRLGELATRRVVVAVAHVHVLRLPTQFFSTRVAPSQGVLWKPGQSTTVVVESAPGRGRDGQRLIVGPRTSLRVTWSPAPTACGSAGEAPLASLPRQY